MMPSVSLSPPPCSSSLSDQCPGTDSHAVALGPCPGCAGVLLLHVLQSDTYGHHHWLPAGHRQCTGGRIAGGPECECCLGNQYTCMYTREKDMMIRFSFNSSPLPNSLLCDHFFLVIPYALQIFPDDRTPFFLYMLYPPFCFYRFVAMVYVPVTVSMHHLAL